VKLKAQIILLAVWLWGVSGPAGAQDTTALEQRIESLRAQLRDVTDKQAALQTRLNQLDEELKPENIQNRAALTGLLDADAARAQVRKQLEDERTRTQQQLDLLNTSQSRLETAISEGEAEAVRRRAAALAPPQTTTSETNQAAPTTTATASNSSSTNPRRPARRHTRSRKTARRATSKHK
jgi:chromosome segregation ATPase